MADLEVNFQTFTFLFFLAVQYKLFLSFKKQTIFSIFTGSVLSICFDKAEKKLLFAAHALQNHTAGVTIKSPQLHGFLFCHRITRKEGTQRSGTGDIFASIIAADAVNGVPFYKSVKKASDFIKKCIIRSQELDIPLTDGVCFEEVLGKLKTD